jgi:transcriptional regulator with XRE-family HTH domain
VGVRLQEARKLGSITARELDRLALTTEGHTSLIESGVVQNVTLDTAGKLAGALGVTLDWLVNGTGDLPTAPSVRLAIEGARSLRSASESGEHSAVTTSTGTEG